ncbi:hypothetical protein ACCT20_36625, partial [Rhizobium ruizarguesonis]
FCDSFMRHAWRTTQQEWTTSFALGGLLCGSFAMPSFGVAVFGTAFAGWWAGVLLFGIVMGLVGNRVGTAVDA